jgi:hypothetical protein
MNMNQKSQSGSTQFDSQNSEIIFWEGTIDTTVRPLRPSLRRLIEEKRKELANDPPREDDKTPPPQEPPPAK